MKINVIIRTYFLIFIRLAIYSTFLYFEFKIFYQLNDYEINHVQKKNDTLNSTKSNIKLQDSNANLLEVLLLIYYLIVGLIYILVKATATFRWGFLIYIECIILEITLTRIIIRFKKSFCCEDNDFPILLIFFLALLGLFPFFYPCEYSTFEKSNTMLCLYIAIFRIFYLLYALLSFVKEAVRKIDFNILIFLLIILIISILIEYYFPFLEDCDLDEECCRKKNSKLIEEKKNIDDEDSSSSSSSEEEEKKNESNDKIIINDDN